MAILVARDIGGLAGGRGNGGGDRIGRHLVAGMGIMLRQQRHGGQG